jgi:hypothetical protein
MATGPESQLELISPLSPTECAARIAAAIETWRSDGLVSERVGGSVCGGSFRLWKRIGYQNICQTILSGTLQSRGTGTMIRGWFGMSTLVLVGMACWFGFILFGGAIVVLVMWRTLWFESVQVEGNVWVGFAFILGMLAFGIGLIWFGRYLARGEAAFLRHFLLDVLKAPSGTGDVQGLRIGR